MRKLFAAGLCALGVLAFAGSASAGVSVGVNDDAGKYSDGAPQFWTTMKSNGLKQNAITVLWDETQPTTIVDQSFLDHALPAAKAAGISVVFDVYPMHSQAFTQNGATYAQFGAFLTKLAQRYPDVTQYVVMNECNQTRFINPQFNATGVNQSAAICGQALAAGYDALKAVNTGITVWGVGLSPRGNDNASASSNVSTSPVKFLAALGAWYRSSGRTAPLMDGFDFHPYYIPQSLPFATGYADTDNAGVANLDRIYQAFYDAFKNTSQKVIGQVNGGGLPVSLNEVGVQTDNTGKAGYTGTETSGDANGGVRGDTATEKFQSDWYLQMLNYVACDPNVKVVNFFHLVDESDLGGWQSGLYYVGYAPKASAGAVQTWISQTGGNCTGTQKTWTPSGAPTGGATGGDTGGDANVLAQLQTLFSSGVFDDVGTGIAGPVDALSTREHLGPLINDLFGPSSPVLSLTGRSSFSDVPPNVWASSFNRLASSLLQGSPLPSLTLPSQSFLDLLSLSIGPLELKTQLTAGLYSCTGSCTAGSFASQALARCAPLGLCVPSARTTASALAAPRRLAVGTATVAAGKAAKLKLKAVKGAKQSYGRYVLVLRLASPTGAAKPAAIAVRFSVKHKSAATKAKPAKGKAKPKATPKKK